MESFPHILTLGEEILEYPNLCDGYFQAPLLGDTGKSIPALC